MDLHQHAWRLGKLVGNLHSLEFLLRAFLHEQPSARPLGVPYGRDLFASSEGEFVPLNDFTSWDSLGDLIDKANQALAQSTVQPIDTTIVRLRDAIAHGRVSAPTANEHLRLVKFGKPNGAQVQVEFNAELSEAWFTEQTKLIASEIEKLASCLKYSQSAQAHANTEIAAK